MKQRVSLSGLDSAFPSLEMPSTPMHLMGTFVLDASSESEGATLGATSVSAGGN
jgi:hypothetical protein